MNSNDERIGGWRLSLRMLLVACPVVAIGIAALARPTYAWTLAIGILAALLMMMALVAAVFERGSRQAFAIGFLLCAALHLLLFHGLQQSPSRLLLEEAYFQLHTEDAIGGGNGVGMLRYGSGGPLVEALQAALNEQPTTGQLLDVDGDFGVQTDRAVKAFQTAHGLPPDGVVNVSVWRALGTSARQALKLYDIALSPMKTVAADHFASIGGWLATLAAGFVGGLLAEIALARRLARAEV